MTAVAWAVSSGSYSDYTVHAVALTEAEARAWADAYNAAQESYSRYRDPATVEEIELYRDGDPLPRLVTVYNADAERVWPWSFIATGPVPEPSVDDRGMRRGPFAQYYPTAEAARAAVDSLSEPTP